MAATAVVQVWSTTTLIAICQMFLDFKIKGLSGLAQLPIGKKTSLKNEQNLREYFLCPFKWFDPFCPEC